MKFYGQVGTLKISLYTHKKICLFDKTSNKPFSKRALLRTTVTTAQQYKRNRTVASKERFRRTRVVSLNGAGNKS